MSLKFFFGKEPDWMSKLEAMLDGENEVEIGTEWTVFNDARGSGVEIKVTGGEVCYQLCGVAEQQPPTASRLAVGIWIPLDGRVILRSMAGAKALVRPL